MSSKKNTCFAKELAFLYQLYLNEEFNTATMIFCEMWHGYTGWK